MNALTNLFNRRKSRVRRTLKATSTGRAAPFGAPLIEAHLRAGDRRRRRQDASPPPRRSRRISSRSLKTGADKAAAAAVGKLIAERAIKAGVKDVVFDRGGYIYHGRVKALADAAREGGLNF